MLSATSYQLLYLQQSPGQHDEPSWQQLVPQQFPGQHFAPGLQQDAPVSASADRENSDVAIRAITLAFIGNSFQREKGRLRTQISQARRNTRRTLNGLNPQVVFETKDCGPELQPSGQLTQWFSA